MKSSFLVAVIFCIVFCLVFSTTDAAGAVDRRSRCNQGLCRTNLVRRDDVGDQYDVNTDTIQGLVSGESEPTPTLVDVEESSSEFTQYVPTSQEDLAVNSTPTPTVSTLWDENGNAFVFPSTSLDEYGNPVLSTPTPVTSWDDNGSMMVVTPTPSVSTLWDENGSVVFYTPTNNILGNEQSAARPTEYAFPTDQSANPIESPSPVPTTEEVDDTSTGNPNAENETQISSSTGSQNMPVIIGGSVGALALVVGIGGFVGYRTVRNRRKSQWFKPEYSRDTKGFFDLKEVAEIAAHSPGMNTPMPTKNHTTLSIPLPVIPQHSPLSTPVISSVPPLAHRNSTYSSLFVPHFAQPTRTSTQSSVGIRESALEETIIVGFSAFDESGRHRDSTNYRLSTSPSVNITEANVVVEEPLFVMTALLPYMPQRPNEMLVQSGDEIVITEEVGEEWLGGYNKSRDPDTKGYFPRTCVTGSSYL